MSRRDLVAGHSLAGILLLTVGVFIPGLLATAGALIPGLDWVRGPQWASPAVNRAVALAFGVYALAAGYGFVLHRRWAWWMVVVLGAFSLVQWVLHFLRTLPTVGILIWELLMVALLVYAIRRRRDFGVFLDTGSP